MRCATLVFVLLMLPLSGCLKPVPADPDLQTRFRQRTVNVMLEFATDKGKQVAYFLPARTRPAAPPSRLALVYSGINSRALDWLPLIDDSGHPDTAYLLIEYPGRGLSEGMMRPEELYKNSAGALTALAAHFGLAGISAELSLLGHSFGSGAALQFATRRQVKRIILVAPFTDLKQAVARQSWFLALVMPSQIDNRRLIRQLLAHDQPPQITILHGLQDNSLPVEMGRELAGIAPERITFLAFTEDDHMSILTRRRELIFSLLAGANP